MSQTDFTPAAGRFVPTAAYDYLLALLTRERIWRDEILLRLAPQPGERILDVGCGTGSLALLLKQAQPDAILVGLDPDPEARAIAASKARAAGVSIDWHEGYARDAASLGQFDKVVCSLVFHQVPLAEKEAGIAALIKAAKPGGTVCIVDYARQDRWLMRQLFRIIQSADGVANTQPNADGFIEQVLTRHYERAISADWSLDTPTGTISLFALVIEHSPL